MTFISLLLISMLIAAVMKRKLTDVLLPTSCLYMLVGYLLALLCQFRYWKFISSLLIFFAIVMLLAQRNRLKDTLSLNIILFLAFYIGVFIFCRRIVVTGWDDLNHWAVITKQIYYLGAVPTDEISVSSYSDYPPIAAIWINLFLSDFSNYREDVIFGVWNILLGMCFLPFWELIDKKNAWYKNIFLSILCMLLPLAMAYSSLYTLQVDCLVGLMSMYVLCKISKWNEISCEDVILLGIVLSALALVKAVSIVMVIECLLAIITMLYIKRTSRKVSISFCIAVVGVAISFASWKIFCFLGGNSSFINTEFKSNGLSEYFTSFLVLVKTAPIWLVVSIIVSVFVLVFSFRFSVWRSYLLFIEAINCIFVFFMCETDCYIIGGIDVPKDSFHYIGTKYWQAFCKWGVNTDVAVSSFEGVSTLECITLCILVMTIISCEIKQVGNLKVIIWILGIFSLLFCVAHLSMYLFLFTGEEQNNLSAYNRYLSLVLFPFVGITVYLAMAVFLENTNRSKTAALLVLFLIVTMINYKYELIQFGMDNNSKTIIQQERYNRQTLEKITDDINQMVELDQNNTYCVILGGDATSYDHYMRYLLMPAKLGGFINSDNRSEEEIVDAVQKQCYDYVFIYTPALANGTELKRIINDINYVQVSTTEDGFMILRNNALR